ncbi:glycoside hydrolase [Streptomyces sp. NPDC002851]
MDPSGLKRRRRYRTWIVAAGVAAVTSAAGAVGYAALAEKDAAATPPVVHGGKVTFTVSGGTATVDTASLRVTGRASDGTAVPVSDSIGKLGRAGRVSVDGHTATWSYPSKHLKVSAARDHGRLRVTVHADTDTTLAWPVTGKSAGADRHAAFQIPRGEGLSVPVSDTFWNAKNAGLAGTEADLAGGSLTLPLWGYTTGSGHGVSYLVPESIGTTLGFTSHGGKLSTTATHEFSRRERTRDYTVAFSLTGPSPVAAAADYHKYLDERGQLRTLKQKFTDNPEAKKLLGAEHAYLWGRARGEEAVKKLHEQGSTRLWLGYDADGKPMTEQAVSTAKKLGYLVGPYDSYANGQDPKSADTPIAKWPGTIYPDSCIRDWKGKVKTGFADRGCYLSSQAFARSEPSKHYLADHTRKMVATGANSVFLDVDAAGELFSDFTKAHPMTKKQDRANRMERMRALSERHKLVLGSETAVSWSAPALTFTHGAQTPVNDGLWKFQAEKDKWGGWYPADAPGQFFKKGKLPASLATSMYDPRYRIPMYETALHDSVISTDRWEMPYDKLPDLKTDRALMSVLYNTPLNFAISEGNLASTGQEMATLQRYFAPLHKAAGTERMTDFRRLTDDHQVQRSVFGYGKLTITANFGSTAYGSLPGGCVDAKLRHEKQTRRLCPAKG